MVFKELYDIWKKEGLLEEALKKTHSMFKKDKQMFATAFNALVESKDEDAKVVGKNEKTVDKHTKFVRKNIVEYLAANSSPNISAALVLTSIVIDLERIGDISEDIIDLELIYPKRLNDKVYLPKTVKLEQQILRIFDLTKSAFMDSDAKIAKETVRECEGIKLQCAEIFGQLWNDKKIAQKEIIIYTLLLRYFTRVAGHLRNINLSVIKPFHKMGD